MRYFWVSPKYRGILRDRYSLPLCYLKMIFSTTAAFRNEHSLHSGYVGMALGSSGLLGSEQNLPFLYLRLSSKYWWLFGIFPGEPIGIYRLEWLIKFLALFGTELNYKWGRIRILKVFEYIREIDSLSWNQIVLYGVL